MADKKISQLSPSTTPLVGTEELPLVQSGVTKKASVLDLTDGLAISPSEVTIGDVTIIDDNSGDNLFIKNAVPPQGWVVQFGSTPFDTGSSEACAIPVFDSQGNMYTTTVAYDGSQYVPLLVKYDADGNLVWQKTNTVAGTTQPGVSITIDSNDELIMCSQSILFKMDTDGNVLWYKVFNISTPLPGGGTIRTIYDVAVDASRNVFIVINATNNSSSLAHGCVMKFSPTGTVLESVDYVPTGTTSFLSSVINVDGLGNVYATFDDFVVKFTNALVKIWERKKTATIGSSDIFMDIAFDSSNNVYLLTNQEIPETTPRFCPVVLKLDGSGNTLWIKGFYESATVSNKGWAIDVDGNNNVVVFSIGDNPTYPSTSNEGGYLTTLNSNGVLLQSYVFLNTTSWLDQEFYWGWHGLNLRNNRAAVAGEIQANTGTSQSSGFFANLPYTSVPTSGTYGKWIVTNKTSLISVVDVTVVSLISNTGTVTSIAIPLSASTISSIALTYVGIITLFGTLTNLSITGSFSANSINTTALTIASIPVYATNAAALAGGLVAGNVYRTGENLKIVF